MYLNVEAMPKANAMPSANSSSGEEPRRQRDAETPGDRRSCARSARSWDRTAGTGRSRQPTAPTKSQYARRSGPTASRRRRGRRRRGARSRRRASEACAIVKPYSALEILRHPDRQRGEAAEYDRVILAVFPDARIAQHRQLLPTSMRPAADARIRRGQHPEQQRRRPAARPHRPWAPSASHRLRSATGRRTC